MVIMSETDQSLIDGYFVCGENMKTVLEQQRSNVWIIIKFTYRMKANNKKRSWKYTFSWGYINYRPITRLLDSSFLELLEINSSVFDDLPRIHGTAKHFVNQPNLFRSLLICNSGLFPFSMIDQLIGKCEQRRCLFFLSSSNYLLRGN